jgi:hypothetical protein
MQFVSRKMDISGNFNISNFCTPTNATGGINIGGGVPSVKLVA